MNELFSPEPAADSDQQNGQQSGLWGDMPVAASAAPPAYRVLARKYRPVTFDQLIGQEAMVRTLSNAIDTGRLPHAWMLTGVRGIGKTTTARILARALNCVGVDGKGGATVHPCGKCDPCRTIMEDRHVDVMEMDAASRTGVDDIRDIIDGVRYGPVSARYKIYILDEVHMLSKNAFNALLKTLEEPPPHTKFIFATTEIRKVPVTVLSRCQRFDLSRIDSEHLAQHFTSIAAKEDATAEAEAMKLIAHAADGSVRDGLSLLDQAIARGNGVVTTDDVKAMLGLADRSHSLNLCRHILRGQMKDALNVFALMQQSGSDSLQILQDMADLIHMLTRGQAVPDYARDAALPEYDRQLLTDLSDIKVPALTRAWQILLKGLTEVQTAPDPAQAAEMILIRLAYAAELPLPGDLVRQIRDAAANGQLGGASTPSPSGGPAPRARLIGLGATASVGTAAVPMPITAIITETVAVAQVMPANFKELVALFDQNREGVLYAQLYSNIHPVHFEPGFLEIRVGQAEAPANLANRMTQCLTEWTGRRWMISISDKAGEPTLAEQDEAVERGRRERAESHPLVQAVVKTFPGAKLVQLRRKELPPITAPTDDASDKDDDIMIEMTEFED